MIRTSAATLLKCYGIVLLPSPDDIGFSYGAFLLSRIHDIGIGPPTVIRPLIFFATPADVAAIVSEMHARCLLNENSRLNVCHKLRDNDSTNDVLYHSIT